MYAKKCISNSYILLIIIVNIMRHYRPVTNQMKSESTKQIFPQQNKVKQLKWHLWLVSNERYGSVQYGTQLCLFPLLKFVIGTKIGICTIPLFGTLSLGYLPQQRVPKGWS